MQQKSLASELQSRLVDIEEIIERKDNPYPFGKYTDSYQIAIATLGEYLQIQEDALTLDHILSKTDQTGSLITDSRQQDPVFSGFSYWQYVQDFFKKANCHLEKTNPNCFLI